MGNTRGLSTAKYVELQRRQYVFSMHELILHREREASLLWISIVDGDLITYYSLQTSPLLHSGTALWETLPAVA